MSLFRPKKRVFLILGVLLAVAGLAVVLWQVNDWPSPRLLLLYGRPTTAGPEGAVRSIEGIEFVEIGPGYCRMGSHKDCQRGDLLGRLSAWFGLPWGTQAVHKGRDCPPRWVELPYRIRIARTNITAGQYWSVLAPGRFARSEPGHPKECLRRKAIEFCERLGEKAGLRFRFPRRLELEYIDACDPTHLLNWERSARRQFCLDWFEEIPAGMIRPLTLRPVVSTDDTDP